MGRIREIGEAPGTVPRASPSGDWRSALTDPPPQDLASWLRDVWKTVTPESIGPALAEARRRVAEAPEPVGEEVEELMEELERLELWLRDR